MARLHHLLTRWVQWYLFRYRCGTCVRWMGGEAPYTVGVARYVVRDVMPAYTEYHLWREDRMVAWVVEADLEPWEDTS